MFGLNAAAAIACGPVAAALAWALPAQALAEPVALVPYFAEYEMTLEGQPGVGDIAGVTGHLVLEFGGSACAGYTNEARNVTVIETREGDRLVTDVRTHTVESSDGRMTFTNTTFLDGDVVENVSGVAELTADGVTIAMSEPAAETVRLAGSFVFPTEQVTRIIAAARRGERFLTLDLYDGSLDGRLIYNTAVVIGAPVVGPAEDTREQALIVAGGFADMRAWPVTISYFEKDDVREDATPDFVMALTVYENGIGRSFVIDYGDFALGGRLTTLEVAAAESCD